MAGEDSSAGERTEEATQQRRDDFRKRGQVVHSREIGTVLMFFGAALSLWTLSRFYSKQFNIVLSQALGTFVVDVSRTGDLFAPMRFMAEHATLMVLPLAGIFGFIAVASSALQTGFLSKEDALEPNFDHINPINGFKRLLGLRSVVEALKASLKLVAVGYVAWLVIEKEFSNAPLLVGYSVEQLAQYIGTISIKLLFTVGLSMAVLALMDYGYQWWDLEKQMRMTKQEIKEESKNREGDPQIKARVRRIQREMAQRRMMDKVPKADVIITNPTHIAVALKYGADLPAPQVIAKGADLIAEKIKSLAREHGIPIVENKPLARTIFKTLKIGQVIPKELYNAVAEVLAYVYRLKKRMVR